MRNPLFLVLSILFFISGAAQVNKDKAILNAYSKYFEAPREYVHVHLNKTTLIDGEPLGFTAYVFNAFREPSLRATNLYCTITDSSNTIIKKKLLMVQKGVASNIFVVDSTLPVGEYKFNAYTNWMRNFDDKLYFSKSIRILGPDSTNPLNAENEKVALDVQILPEGGHFLQNIENVLGVIIKNQFGKGIGIESGVIVNQLNDTLSTFKLDKFGIGRTRLRPVEDESYFVQFNYSNTSYKEPIRSIQRTGILLNTSKFFNQVLVKVATNLNTLPSLQNKEFVLALHNANSIKTWLFDFSKGPRLELKVDEESLKPGMNIFTVFDSNNTPILERLYFNYDGLPLLESGNPIHQAYADTLKVMVKIPKADPVELNNLSVSVLPVDTRSYNSESNLISNLFLRPYIKGYIQDAAYYFTDVDKKKRYDIDNLLITQGWSSYDWRRIFGPSPAVEFPYEQGISLRASVNTKKGDNSYLMQPMKFTKSFIFDLEPGDTDFVAEPLYPIDGETISISEISKSGKLTKPSIVPLFSPSKIPNLDKAFFKTENVSKLAELTDNNELFTSLDDIQQLETVEIKAVVKRTRYERLKKISRGSLDIFDDEKRYAYTDFATYIQSKGFIVLQQLSRTAGTPILQILNPVRNNVSASPEPPLIILDGVILTDFSILYGFDMDTVDYIEIDKLGSSMGLRGSNGVIRIVTDPSVKITQKSFKEVQNIEIPLKFSKAESYYVPKYQSYNSSFFRQFGVIDWFPNLKLDRRGAINIDFNSMGNKEFVLFIEGFVNGKDFISEVKTISLN